ncbi:MAG: GGDEF domain-containing protein [Oscillospiraceae bacterium]|nr:GGDEF domain-containing protein [Oscillospiraceae bacterium]
MASKQMSGESSRIKRIFTIAGIVFLLIMAFNMVVENLVYVRSRRVYDANMQSVEIMSQMNDRLSSINESIGMMAAGMSDQTTLDSIDQDLAAIDTLKDAFLEAGGHSDMELRRFNQASYAIQGYRRKINEVRDTLPTAGYERARSIYMQELAPLKVCAAEMLDATAEINTRTAKENVHSSTLMHGVAQLVLMLITVLTLAALAIAARHQLRAVEEIEAKKAELREAEHKIGRSMQKVEDAAYTNILTGLPNRYALEMMLEDLLNNVQFHAAVFDIDNFRSINDTYGLEFGDRYLIDVAERLGEFAEVADIYNISGNEFFLLFHDDLTDMEVQQTAEQVRQTMGAPTMIDGIVIQQTVSGALSHVLPSGTMDTNTLLMKLDSALHAAKRDGGDRLSIVR